MRSANWLEWKNRLNHFLWNKFEVFIIQQSRILPKPRPGNTKGGSITVPLTSCLTSSESGVWQLTIFVFICNRLIQTSQTGGQQYSDTSPLSIPCLDIFVLPDCLKIYKTLFWIYLIEDLHGLSILISFRRILKVISLLGIISYAVPKTLQCSLSVVFMWSLKVVWWWSLFYG